MGWARKGRERESVRKERMGVGAASFLAVFKDHETMGEEEEAKRRGEGRRGEGVTMATSCV